MHLPFLERAVAESVRYWGKLDVAIANAGFGVVGPLKKLSLDDYRRQFETNVFGVLRTIYAALPEIEKTTGNVAIMGPRTHAAWLGSMVFDGARASRRRRRLPGR